jgi:hypothetical protein
MIAITRGDQSHPAAFSDNREDFGIQRKARLVLECVGPQALHGTARLLALESDHFFSGNLSPPGQPKDVINSSGPD